MFLETRCRLEVPIRKKTVWKAPQAEPPLTDVLGLDFRLLLPVVDIDNVS
jgi:hypothetical protein